MTYSSQPTTSARQVYPSYGPRWSGYDLHEGGYSGSQMLPPPQLPGQVPSSPGAPRVPTGPPENHPVNCPTYSCSNPPPEPSPSAPRRPMISLPKKRFQPSAEPRKTDDQEMQNCPHSRWCSTTMMMQMMRATIRHTWVVQKVNCQSAGSKLNSPWSNLPKEWGRPTIVHSTSGRKHGWLGAWRRSISP